jgi:hypothetical protein
MRECDAGAKKKYARPDGIDFLIEGDQNVPDEKGESSDWGVLVNQGEDEEKVRADLSSCPSFGTPH